VTLHLRAIQGAGTLQSVVCVAPIFTLSPSAYRYRYRRGPAARFAVAWMAFPFLLAGVPQPASARPYAYVATHSDFVEVIDAMTGEEAKTIDVNGLRFADSLELTGVAVTPDGLFAYVTELRHSVVLLIDTYTNKVEGEPIVVGQEPTAIAITPNGRFAYVTNLRSSTVSVLRIDRNYVSTEIPVRGEPVGIAIAPSGAVAYVAHARDGGVSVIDITTNREMTFVPTSGRTLQGVPALGVAFTPDGMFAYVINGDDTIGVVDARAHRLVRVIGTPNGDPGPIADYRKRPLGIAFSSDGTLAYVPLAVRGRLAIIDTARGTLRKQLDFGVRAVVGLPDGRALALGRDDPSYLIDVDSRRILYQSRLASRAVALSPKPGWRWWLRAARRGPAGPFIATAQTGTTFGLVLGFAWSALFGWIARFRRVPVRRRSAVEIGILAGLGWIGIGIVLLAMVTVFSRAFWIWMFLSVMFNGLRGATSVGHELLMSGATIMTGGVAVVLSTVAAVHCGELVRRGLRGNRDVVVRHEKGAGNQWMRVLLEQLSVQFDSYPWGGWGDLPVLSDGDKGPRMVVSEQTRGLQRAVNPEQASKVLMRPPTRQLRGEGRCVSGKQPTSAPGTGAGVLGAAREEGSLGNVGGPIGCGVAPATSPWVAA
jgi:YVTN family beta-propeller protein